jgi:pimeloyl-ACP methyl ester carboxylesterase
MPMVRTRDFAWSWHGQDVAIGVDEMGDGPAILLLPAPSSISTRRELHPLMAALEGAGRLIAPDWPGFGDRPRPAVAWSPDAFAAFLEAFVVHETPAPLHATIAAGHAAGYALRLAAPRHGRLGRLALLAPTWRGPLPTVAGGERRLFGRLRQVAALPVVGPLLYRLNVNGPVVRMMVTGHVYSDPKALRPEWHAARREVTGAPGARHASVAFVTGGLDPVASREAFLALARAAGVPILVAYGAETPPRSRAEMEALAALPGVQKLVLPRGKLGLHEEFAAELAAPLRAFLG